MTAPSNKNAAAASGPSLNVYKKIAVIRKPSDSLTYEDGEGNWKSVSAEQLGDALHHATLAAEPQKKDAAKKKKAKPDIPVPIIRNVASYQTQIAATYGIPLAYVRCHRPTPQQLYDTLEYVVDEEDEAWLDDKNQTRFGSTTSAIPSSSRKRKLAEANDGSAAPPAPPLSLHLFERMMDLLEKETGFDAIITTAKAEEVFRAKLPLLFTRFADGNKQNTSAGDDDNSSTPITAKHVVHEVYTYWMQKRSRLKRPLFRRFWPVTSLDDTNPHLVFRPREKEKYKLRNKRRQNDMDAFRKLQILRQDFDTVRAVLALVQRREALAAHYWHLQCEVFRQQLARLLDTTGILRQARPRLTKSGLVEMSRTVPVLFDTQTGKKTGRRSRNNNQTASGMMPASDIASLLQQQAPEDDAVRSGAPATIVAAGHNHGEPAPHFLHPLATREAYVMSWENATPHVSSYVDSHAEPTTYFRTRPRVGRGGRICLDRLPRPPTAAQQQPVTVFTASKGLVNSSTTTNRLLELLPRPLDTERLSRRVQDVCMASIFEEQQHHAAAAADATVDNNPENDGDEVVVKLDDWLDTDDHLWGDERHSLGPF